MKKVLLICVTFAFFLAAAVAQTTPRGSQGTQQSSPGMSQSGQPGQQPSTTQPDNTTGMGQTDQNNPNQNRTEKGEKKLKGCVQLQGGQYVLETKKGKAVTLTGQDVSAHAGHEVAVKGNWESGASAGTGVSSSSGNASGAQKAFNVTSVEMISESCGGKHGNSGNMGTSGTGTTPNGNTGTGSAPPQ